MIAKPFYASKFVVLCLPALALSAYIAPMLISSWLDRTAKFKINNESTIEYMVSWRWGMVQTISISRNGFIMSQASEDVFKKPYHAIGLLFFDKTDDNYYIGTTFGIYKIDYHAYSVYNVCNIDLSVIDRVEYIGSFTLTDLVSDTRGDDVTFTPSGRSLPIGYRSVDNPRLFNGRCG